MRHARAAALTAALVVAYGMMAPGAEAQRSGAEIWSNTCGSCHALQPPGRYTAKDWQSIGTHMIIQARLTTAQGNAVLEFLRQGARETTAGAAPETPSSRQTASSAEPVTGLMGVTEEPVASKATDPVRRYKRQLRSNDALETDASGG